MPLKVQKRGATFYALGTVAGRRIRKSLGTGDRRQADEACAILEAWLWKRGLHGDEAVRTFADAAVSYQESGADNRFLAPLIRRFGRRVLGSIKPGEVREAARALYPNAKASTRNRQVIVPVRAIINHAASLGWCAPIKVSPFPVEKVRRSFVKRNWIDAFLAQCDADGLAGLAAAVLFMHQTGARVSEAAHIMPEHLDLGERRVWLAKTKTDQWQARYITTELLVRIANLPQAPGRPVFGYADRFGIRNRLKAVCRRAGIPYVPTHQSGKHSFVTNAIAGGASVRDVMDASGSKTPNLLVTTYQHSEDAGRAIAERFDAELTQRPSDNAQPIAKKG